MGIVIGVIVTLVLLGGLAVGGFVLTMFPRPPADPEQRLAGIATVVNGSSFSGIPATPPPALRPGGRTGDEAVLGYEWDAPEPKEGAASGVAFGVEAAQMHGDVYVSGYVAPHGAFAGVLLSVWNHQETPARILPELLSLRGPDGTLHPVSAETMSSKLPLVADPLEPGRATTGIVIFDVPADLDLENSAVVVAAGTESEVVLPMVRGAVYGPED